MSGGGARGPGAAGAGPGPSPDSLAELIAAGLAERAQAPVDVDGLLAGARTGARRIRRRRRAARIAAVAVAVAAVPVVLAGTGVLGRLPWPATSGQGSQDSEAAGSSASVPASGVAGGTTAPGATYSGERPLGTRMSGSTGPGLPRDAAGRVVIPDAAVLQAGDVAGTGPQRTADVTSPQPAGPAPVPVCAGAAPVDLEPAGSRQVGYLTPAVSTAAAGAAGPAGGTGAAGGAGGAGAAGGTGAPAGLAVLARVQVLPGDTAAAELEWLRRSMGYCPGPLRLSRAPVAGVPGDGVVLGYQVGPPAGQPHDVVVIGVVRQGRTLAGLELTVPESAAADDAARVRVALDQARYLLAVSDRRLTSSGLAPGAAADPSLSP